MAADSDRKAGAWVLDQVQGRRVWLFFAAFVCADVGVMIVWLQREWILGFLLAGMAATFLYALRESVELAVIRLRGGRAEQEVGEVLKGLRRGGYLVLNDLMFGGEGNLDHLVSGPNGVFLIETKPTRYESSQLTKVKRQAARVHDELGNHWVTPVMCAGSRRKKPYKHDGVWITGSNNIVQLITSLNGKPVDPERLYRFTDRLS